MNRKQCLREESPNASQIDERSTRSQYLYFHFQKQLNVLDVSIAQDGMKERSKQYKNTRIVRSD